LYGAGTWTLRKVDKRTLKVLNCGAGEDEKDRLDDRLKNEEVLRRVKEEMPSKTCY
jgi:hypothetical protein